MNQETFKRVIQNEIISTDESFTTQKIDRHIKISHKLLGQVMYESVL